MLKTSDVVNLPYSKHKAYQNSQARVYQWKYEQ